MKEEDVHQVHVHMVKLPGRNRKRFEGRFFMLINFSTLTSRSHPCLDILVEARPDELSSDQLRRCPNPAVRDSELSRKPMASGPWNDEVGTAIGDITEESGTALCALGTGAHAPDKSATGLDFHTLNICCGSCEV